MKASSNHEPDRSDISLGEAIDKLEDAIGEVQSILFRLGTGERFADDLCAMDDRIEAFKQQNRPIVDLVDPDETKEIPGRQGLYNYWDLYKVYLMADDGILNFALHPETPTLNENNFSNLAEDLVENNLI